MTTNMTTNTNTNTNTNAVPLETMATIITCAHLRTLCRTGLSYIFVLRQELQTELRTRRLAVNDTPIQHTQSASDLLQTALLALLENGYTGNDDGRDGQACKAAYTEVNKVVKQWARRARYDASLTAIVDDDNGLYVHQLMIDGVQSSFSENAVMLDLLNDIGALLTARQERILRIYLRCGGDYEKAPARLHLANVSVRAAMCDIRAIIRNAYASGLL